MEKTDTSPDAFIASQPDDRRTDLETLDSVLSRAMSGHTRVMWEGRFWGGSDQKIIGYGDFSYDRPSGTVDWFMIGLAPQKNHISIYVNAADEDGYLVKKHASRLGKVKVGAAAISFKSVADIDLAALEDVAGLARDKLA